MLAGVDNEGNQQMAKRMESEEKIRRRKLKPPSEGKPGQKPGTVSLKLGREGRL